MNPTTPEQFNFAIQNAIESTFNLIVAQCGEDIKFEWEGTRLTDLGGSGAIAFVDSHLPMTRGGRYILDRLNNALNAFGYEARADIFHSDLTNEQKPYLRLQLSHEIQQDASDAQYGDFCDREEEQLKKSGRIY
jgi:hypothetical protein